MQEFHRASETVGIPKLTAIKSFLKVKKQQKKKKTGFTMTPIWECI